MGGSKPLVKGDLHKKVTISTTGIDFDTGNDFYSLFPKGPESSIPKFTVGEKGTTPSYFEDNWIQVFLDTGPFFRSIQVWILN